MSGIYIDTSALGRVLLGEPDGPAVVRELGRYDRRVASRLLRIELRRLALRYDLLEEAGALAATVALVPLEQTLLDHAETVEPAAVATLDAIHLVTALRLAEAGLLDAVMTFDGRLAAAAAAHGLAVVAPS